MRYFYDCEFIENGPHRPLYLLSIGVVAEDGRTLYVQNLDAPIHLANDWVVEHVFPHLEALGKHPSLLNIKSAGGFCADANKKVWQHREAIAERLRNFFGDDSKIELWGYYSAYDHVAFCQIFGTMAELPKGFPQITYDLRQWLDSHGLQHVKQPDDMPHHALSDAKWIHETAREYHVADLAPAIGLRSPDELTTPVMVAPVAREGGQEFWRQNEE